MGKNNKVKVKSKPSIKMGGGNNQGSNQSNGPIFHVKIKPKK